MTTDKRNIEVIVSGKRIDISNGFDLTLNAVVQDPTSVSSRNSEYSYSFSVPITPNNARIFGYANIPSIKGKFTRTFYCEVSADGLVVFGGTLRLSGVSNGMFQCNLLVLKNNTLQDIFGDKKLSDIDWKIDFNGISSINAYNANQNNKFWFPLVCYGAFAKTPIQTYETYNEYSSIYSIDYTNKFYNSTFYPSLNMMETVKRCFDSVGYQVEGTALHDAFLNNIYMSTNLDNDQQPIYNLGNQRFGKMEISVQFNNWYQYRRRLHGQSEMSYFAVPKTGEIISLSYPYDQYNSNSYRFDEVSAYNMLSVPSAHTVNSNRSSQYDINPDITVNGDTFMYAKDDGYITIPSDGLYKIELEVTASLLSGSTSVFTSHTANYINGTSMKVRQEVKDDETVEVDITMTNGANLREYKPIEVQLVRNYNNSAELIKGDVSYYHRMGDRPTTANMETFITAYPHQEILNNTTGYPTERISGSAPKTTAYMAKYTPSTRYGVKQSELFLYDPMVNNDFICGFSTIGNCASIIKNGYSWYKGNTSSNDVLYDCNGYVMYDNSNYENTAVDTDFMKNSSLGAPTNVLNASEDGKSLYGKLSFMIYLHKNDQLSLIALTRQYDEVYDDSGLGRSNWKSMTYPIDVAADLKIEAMSPNHSGTFIENGNNYNSPSEFDSQLQLGQFLSSGTTMASFIDDVCKSFNLSFSQNGNVCTLDKQKKNKDKGQYAINIDDRVNSSDNSSFNIERIDFPSSMSVEYSIDTNEAGFYASVPRSKINLNDWTEYGEKGFDKIEFNTEGDATESKVSLNNSYCWYQIFDVYKATYNEVEGADGHTYKTIANSAATATTISIPIICESQYFIDRGNVEEYMHKDGYSQPLRFFFRTWTKQETLPTVYNISGETEVDIYTPVNYYDGTFLNYHSNENNILKRYFNVEPNLLSNYITVDVYLNPLEYATLKAGADVIFDSDIYEIVELQKYSLNGKGKTTLKLMKKY